MADTDALAVKELRKAMEMLLKGTHPAAVELQGCSDDISELMRLFNAMSNHIQELYRFSTALAAGDLDAQSPDKHNFMAAGLKELRSRLCHLAWQAQQVAKGDYKQRVDFMGDFSVAFNTMTEKLVEREGKLKAEIEERKKAETELEHYAFTDHLTGVSNRRTGLMTLEKEIMKSKRDGKALSICFIDIDGLKNVNDMYGHEEGDLLIITVSDTVKSVIRESDTLSRIGGDEFLIILPDCSARMAKRVIDRISEKMRRKNETGEKPYKLDFSYGIEEIVGGRITTIDDIIKKADEKMYQNKKNKQQL